MDNEYFASINEVSKRLSLPAYTLRYWEKQFPVAIRPTTGAGGRRYYRTETVNKLLVIKDLLYSKGMTIAGVKKLIKEGRLPETVESGFVVSAEVKSNTAQSKEDKEDIKQAVALLEEARKILSSF